MHQLRMAHMLQSDLKQMLHVRISNLIEGHPAIAADIDDAMSSQKTQSVRDR